MATPVQGYAPRGYSMGIDLYDFDEEHLIFRRTVIILPHEAIINRPRTRLCCDLLKKIIYDNPTSGYIYANTNRIDDFKADVIAYIERNWDASLHSNKYRAPRIVEAIKKSMLCCVEFRHDPVKDTGQETEKRDAVQRDRLYLNDEEKQNYHSSTGITCVQLDPLLKEDQYSDADVHEFLAGVFRSDHSISLSGKFVGRDWLEFLILRPTFFGVGVDLNKAIRSLGSRMRR